MSWSQDIILVKLTRMHTSAERIGEIVMQIDEGAPETQGSHVWINGWGIWGRLGVDRCKKGCSDTNGMNHFARDHKPASDKQDQEGKEDGAPSSATGHPIIEGRG